MDSAEFTNLVPWLVAERLDDASAPVQVQPEFLHEKFPSWGFRTGPIITVVAMYPERNELRVTPGLAIDVPYTPAVSHYVNRLNNKELVFGRAFLVGNDESGLGAVLMQEIIFGHSLSWDYPPSVQYALQQIATLSGQAARLAPDVVTRCGGRHFNDGEGTFLQMNG